ncbi:CpsD/CapB family tyrosine-protein kinase [Thermodesulfobacteriota bacterium]
MADLTPQDTEIPISETDPHVLPVLDLGSPVSEQYRRLYSKLLYIQRERGDKVVAITSTSKGEGKTLTAVNLALVMARDTNKRVLLVDLDLRHPKVADSIGIKTPRGLVKVIENKISLVDGFIKLKNEGLFILPAGEVPSNPIQFLAEEKLAPIMMKLKKWFDFVIVDTPPIMPIPDYDFINRQVDSFIMVVRWGCTQKDHVLSALDSCGRDRILGIVFNAAVGGTSTYYHYGYYK